MLSFYSNLACATTIIATATAAAVPPVSKGLTHFITFGDSYSQSGFNATLGLPSATNPFGNPPYPGWTTSGGPNWIGYLAATYNKSLTYSYNFAYGGATVDAALVAPFQPTVLSLIDQIGLFNASIASKPTEAKWGAEDSLFGIWIGVNDVGNSWWQANETELLGKIMNRYFEQVNILYEAGARNFALLSVPPINRTPAMLAQSVESQKLEAEVIKQYNELVVETAANFSKTHPGTKATVIDTQAPFNYVLDHPAEFGAANATCYSDVGTTCLWWNDYHPGVAIHNLTAQAVAKAWPKFFTTNGGKH